MTEHNHSSPCPACTETLVALQASLQQLQVQNPDLGVVRGLERRLGAAQALLEAREGDCQALRDQAAGLQARLADCQASLREEQRLRAGCQAWVDEFKARLDREAAGRLPGGP